MCHVLPDRGYVTHVTHDTSHVTPDTLLEVDIVSKFEDTSSNGLGVIMF